jgi:hypothetical protein
MSSGTALTQDGHHSLILDDLNGTPRNEVEAGKHISLVH